MKSKLLVLLVLNLSIIGNIFSQKTDDLAKLISKVKEVKLVDAKQIADKLETKTEYIENPEFWLYKALLYHTIYDTPTNQLHKQIPDAIEIAYSSYKLALKYDTEKTYNTQIFSALGYLTNQFMHYGLEQFNSGNYDKSLKAFENTIELNALPEIMFNDTIAYYNAALSAEKLKEYDKAIGFYKILIAFKYGEGKMYKDLSEVYKKKGNNDLYLQTLLEGIKFYPEDNNLYIELINHYLVVSDVDNAFIYVNKSIEIDGTNAGMYFVLGSLYESKKDDVNAEKSYLKSLEIDSNYDDAAYNLGVLYYNRAKNIYTHAKTKGEKEKYEADFNKSLKYFKIVEKNEPNDKNVLLSMKNIYRILGMEKEKAEIDKKLEGLK